MTRKVPMERLTKPKNNNRSSLTTKSPEGKTENSACKNSSMKHQHPEAKETDVE